MKISKNDALEWFKVLCEIPSDYSDVFEEFDEIITSTSRQIERAVMADINERQSKLKNLKTLKGRTYYLGDFEKFPPGCISCLTGSGLGSVRKSHQCNLNCTFCYYHDSMDEVEKIPEGMWDIGDNLYEEEDVDLLLSIQEKPTGLAYVYLEPFMNIEAYYNIVGKFKNAGIHQHMYTNGTLCTEENLKALAEAGLDELRFNLGASGCSDNVIEAMRIARKYFKWVGIETPMTPEFYEAFLAKKDEILSIGLDFMNCAELHLGSDNINNYMGEKMYVYRSGYLSPIWSRRITYKIMEMAEKENWSMLIHDCSNYTKFARELNRAKNQGLEFGESTYKSEFDRPVLIAYLSILQDENFEFLEEEGIPDEYKLENCLERIEELSDSYNDEYMENFDGE